MNIKNTGNWVIRARRVQADFSVKVETQEIQGEYYENGLEEENATRPGVAVNALDIPDQGITAVVGASGSGKSTLLGILSGLSKAIAMQADSATDAGESELVLRSHGRRNCNLLRGAHPVPGDVGFVFQDAHLLKSLSAKRNAELGAMVSADAPIQDVFTHWSSELRLEKEGSTPIEKLSGGQQQRVTVMRALGMDPALLVCDEPTSNLDDATADLVMLKIAEWATKPGRAVLWVTHDLELASRYADRFIGVRDGKVLAHGSSPFAQSPAASDEAATHANIWRMRKVLDRCPDGAKQIPEITAPDTSTEGEERQRTNWLRRGSVRMRALGFALACSMADVFSYGLRAKADGCNRVTSMLRGVLGLGLRSLTWVLLLGIIVFYGVTTASSAFNAYFNAQLKAPESSHFVLTAKTTSLLAPKALAGLEKSLVDDALMKREPTFTEPKFYGRRTDQLVEIWPTSNGKCMQQDHGGIGPALLVYNQHEPLYSELEVNIANAVAPTLISGLSSADLRGGVIVTPNFFRFLGVNSKAASQLKGFCANIFGPTYLKIVGVVKSLPGGADSHYDMAVDEKTYRKVFGRAAPDAFRDERGRLTLPAYTEAAGYFDYRDRNRVFCAFFGCRGEDVVRACRATGDTSARSVTRQFSGYQINCDSLAQISRLTAAASGAQWMFGILSLAFIAAIGLSTGLAAQALVLQNEAGIALMRAFGYGLPHIFILLFGKLVVMFLAAAGLFGLLVAIFDWFFAQPLAAAVGVPLVSLTARSETLLIAAVSVSVIVGIVATVVLLVWWLRHRWIGPVLQSL